MIRPAWHMVIAVVMSLTLAPAGSASAADEQKSAGGSQRGEARAAARAALIDWNRDTDKNGWLASSLIETPVFGSGDEQVGEVRNVLVDKSGSIESIVIEAGGPLDGEAPLRVPWREVTVSANLDRVTVPAGKEDLDRYALFGSGALDMAVMAGTYRLTELVNTFATFSDRDGYGLVEDLVFSREGKLKAVVVRPGTGARFGSARFALPYAERMYDRGVGIWKFPFSTDDLAVLRPFENDRPD